MLSLCLLVHVFKINAVMISIIPSIPNQTFHFIMPAAFELI